MPSRENRSSVLCLAAILLVAAPLAQLAGVALASAAQESFDARLAAARSLLEQGRLEDALDPLRRALDMQPDNADVLWLLGVACYELGRLPDGLPHVERLTTIAPEQPRPRLLLGAYYETMGRPRDAVASYVEVLNRDAADRDALLALGRLALRFDDLATARQVLPRLASLYPDDAEAHLAFGRLLIQDGARIEGLRSFQRAVELQETSPDAHYLLGSLYAQLGHAEAAGAHLTTALDLRPDHGPTLFQLGLLAANQQRADDALARFEAAARLLPGDARVHFRLGEARQYLQEIEGAEAAYRDALERDPGLAVARLQLGMLYLDSGRAAEALTELTAVAELTPEDPQVHYQLGRAAADRGNDDDAVRHFEEALRLDPLLTEAYLALGNVVTRQGDRQRGRDLLTRFRELQRADEEIEGLLASLAADPDDVAGKLAFVRLLLTERRYAQARETTSGWLVSRPDLCDELDALHREIAAEDPDSRDLLLGTGELQLICGLTPAAVATLERALAIGPETLEVLQALARAYDAAGRPDDADRTRERAAALRGPGRP